MAAQSTTLDKPILGLGINLSLDVTQETSIAQTINHTTAPFFKNEKENNEREVILNRAEAHLKHQKVKDISTSYSLSRIAVMNPEEIHSMKKCVGTYASMGAVLGGGIGFVAGGGPNPIGAACCVGGAALGGIAGAGVGYMIFMSKTSEEFLKWKKDQTDESLAQFREIFRSTKLDDFICIIGRGIMELPAIDNHGHRADYGQYKKHLETCGIDERFAIEAPDGRKVPNPNRGKSRCVYKCSGHYVTKEDLRVDYEKLGWQIIAIREYIDSHPLVTPSKVTENQLKGLEALHTDLSKKAKWAAELEYEHMQVLVKKNKLKISDMHDRCGKIYKAIGL